ncbi:signal peptidase I [Puniceicoccus vermicola]|uniref:Signal peptidase I n=1 Tax=Puniceicoccus vermicola TaxID=388746 RepID=A0A7X1E4E9_9BACT|nr:signal peptidase I [Puniceicoccus vermicola]MBC2602480.1 signal peptidase I [Puniceicoccus vermicola]
MFSPGKKLRKQAGEYADMARKIINYRKDQLSEKALEELHAVHDESAALSRDKSLSLETLETKSREWEPVLKRHGGKIYPKTFWSDNLETFLVAAIVVLGIRAFFLQPFIIPTNSMYPTYSGMYHQIYDDEDYPSILAKPFRFALLGAKNHEVTAESSGAVRIPLLYEETSGGIRARARYEVVDGRKWLLVPTKLKRYPLFVGNEPSAFDVPLDFDADSVLIDRFFPYAKSWGEVIAKERTTGRFRREDAHHAWIEVPAEQFNAGETVLNFDVLSGDALFVDRFTYHFFPPEPGDPIVFRTQSIDYPPQPLGEKYYIKRLAGTGGDTLEIHPPALFINGAQAEGNIAFVDNAKQIDGYDGYINGGPGMQYLNPGTSYEIPEDHFFALGDNSDNSLDSRYWGSFEEDAVIGRAFFIYYPFTKRWGPAQ